MPSIPEKIKEIEDEIKRTPYNKATQHHIGKLKAKLARLREEGEKRSAGTSGPSYSIKKSGDATVALVGFPSVGKSTLLNKLTNAVSEVGEYDFTTLKVIPGLLEYKDAKIQILDVPGLIEGAASGKGRGKEVISVVRNADLILILLDIQNLKHMDVVLDELNNAGVRINKKPPVLRIKKKAKGGIRIGSTTPLTKLDENVIKSVLSEYKIHNAEVLIREDIAVDQLIDGVAKNRVYIRGLVILNKIDLVSDEVRKKAERKFPDAIQISAEKDVSLDGLKEEIFRALNFIHVYMKPQGKEADLEEPLITREGSTVLEVCETLHRDFKTRFRFARVWGGSVKFGGQRVGLDHVLKDGDILSLILEN
jgi:small GTP-binding protein